jgi:prepilin-type N-terminal cleavage/methylation domain-containing protein
MRRLLHSHRSDRGFTLVELLVSIVLLSIVLGLAATMLIGILRTQSKTSARSDAQQQNQTGMELLTRLLREADYPSGASSTSTIVTSATDTQIVFTSRFSSTAAALAGSTATLGTTQQFVFTLSGTTLKWASVAPNNACATSGVPNGTLCTYTTPTASHLSISGVQNQAAANTCAGVTTPTPVFKYYAAGTALNGALTTPVSASQLANLNVVEIDLYTKTTSGPLSVNCEPLTDYVSLRNWHS